MNRLIATAVLLGLSSPTTFAAHDGDPKARDRQPAWVGAGWSNRTRQPGGSSSALVTSAPGMGFRSSNVTLLSWMSLGDFGITIGGNGASCFGYTAPSGREYALMGLSTGMAIVEITQPGNPVIVTQIPGPQSLWRDMRTFSHYAYVVTEGAGGIQVVDLANVDAGSAPLVDTITTGGSTSTHTVWINTTSGRLYRAGGGGNGLRIYDLNANPAQPTYLGAWSDRYVHECEAVTYPTGGPGGGPREIVITCGGLNNGYTDTGIDIVDASNPASPVLVQHLVYPNSSYSHQAALSPDRQWLYHDDEIDQLSITRVFDASALATGGSLVYAGFFTNGITTDHNLNTLGSQIFESNYRSGLRVFDTSSGVLTPTETAWFDTYPGDDNQGYNGLWNNYPYFPSGVVIGSDIEKGMFVWWVGAPQIGFTWNADELDTVATQGQALAVEVVLSAPGVLQPGSARLWYDAGAGWQSNALVNTTGATWAASLPATPCGTRLRYYFAATATNGVVWSFPSNAPEGSFEVVSAHSSSVVQSFDFESAAGWTTNISGDNATAGRFVRVDPVGTGAQPFGDHSTTGALCWVTGQALPSAVLNDNDVDAGRTTILSPSFDLSTASDPWIRYWRWYSNNEGPAPASDTLRVDVSGDFGASWTNVETVGPAGAGTNGGWIQHAFRVANHVTPTSSVRVRFVVDDLGADSIVEAAIDDVRVFDAKCATLSAFCFGDATGAACPCNNFGLDGGGCANSTGFGSTLAPSGSPSIASDSFVLTATNLLPSTTALFFQGNAVSNGGLGVTFGDGLRCVAGSVVRLGIETAAPTTASYPGAGDPAVSLVGSVVAGTTRYYQAWYRNSASYCTSDGFNLSNGVAAFWQP